MATGQMIKGEIQPGMQIQVDGQGGTVDTIGAVYTTIRTENGSFKVPNAELARTTILVAGGQPQSGGRRRLIPLPLFRQSRRAFVAIE